MTTYSEEFKWMIVKEYLQGGLGYRLLAEKYLIPSVTSVKRWVRAYKHFGKKGIQKPRFIPVYSVQFKLDVLHFRKQTGASLQETAIAFELNDPSLISHWFHALEKEGIEGLQKKAKGRSSMPEKPMDQATTSKRAFTREEQLEREIELLRLELSYVKKLNAFQENPNAYLEKHKQRWYSNSNKKDSK